MSLQRELVDLEVEHYPIPNEQRYVQEEDLGEVWLVGPSCCCAGCLVVDALGCEACRGWGWE